MPVTVMVIGARGEIPCIVRVSDVSHCTSKLTTTWRLLCCIYVTQYAYTSQMKAHRYNDVVSQGISGKAGKAEWEILENRLLFKSVQNVSSLKFLFILI